MLPFDEEGDRRQEAGDRRQGQEEVEAARDRLLLRHSTIRRWSCATAAAAKTLRPTCARVVRRFRSSSRREAGRRACECRGRASAPRREAPLRHRRPAALPFPARRRRRRLPPPARRRASRRDDPRHRCEPARIPPRPRTISSRPQPWALSATGASITSRCTSVLGIVRAGRRLHDVAREQPNHALPIALDAEQAVALTGAEQILQRAEAVLPLVERRVDVAHELLRLAHVHREARRVGRRLEDAAHGANAVGRARLAAGRRIEIDLLRLAR